MVSKLPSPLTRSALRLTPPLLPPRPEGPQSEADGVIPGLAGCDTYVNLLFGNFWTGTNV